MLTDAKRQQGEEASSSPGEESWGAIAIEWRPRLTRAVNSLLRGILKRSENPGYA